MLAGVQKHLLPELPKDEFVWERLDLEVRGPTCSLGARITSSTSSDFWIALFAYECAAAAALPEIERNSAALRALQALDQSHQSFFTFAIWLIEVNLHAPLSLLLNIPVADMQLQASLNA